MSKNALLLYPNQLFAVEYIPKDIDRIVVIEDPTYFGVDPSRKLYLNKQKLVFMQASMRRYVEEVLWQAGYEVDYLELHNIKSSVDIVNHLGDFEKVTYFDTCDEDLNRIISSEIKTLNPAPEVVKLQSPNFYLTPDEVNSFFTKHEEYSFADFYLWQRERFNVLIDPETYKPLGGSLILEAKTPKKSLKDQSLPSFQVYGSNKYVKEATDYVLKTFPDNPGTADDFPWPTNHAEAVKWLDEFIEHRLENYAFFEDNLAQDSPWLFHSAIGPMLNCGMLQPHEVVQKVLDHGLANETELVSVERFVRNILGWREYTRAMYLKKGVNLRTTNTYGHNRGLTADWYSGNTGIEPVDNVIHKLIKHGYAHQSELLAVIGNFMFLCDIHPEEIHYWMLEMSIDTSDWSVVPYVYGIIQGENGQNVANQPMISSSNYILKMSQYNHGPWADIWDGLYWRFLEKNSEKLLSIKTMSIAFGQLKKLSEEQKRITSYRAEDFLQSKTNS